MFRPVRRLPAFRRGRIGVKRRTRRGTINNKGARTFVSFSERGRSQIADDWPHSFKSDWERRFGVSPNEPPNRRHGMRSLHGPPEGGRAEGPTWD